MSSSHLMSYNRLGMDGAECSNDVVTRPKQVINHCMGHSVQHAITLNRDIQSIARHFEEYDDMKQDFIDAFPEWERYRKKSIACLTGIIEELDSIHFNTNVVKTAATVSGVVCGCVGIAGGVADALVNSSASSLQLGASIGGLVSTVVNNGATVTEAGLSKSYISKAKKLLREDLECFESIQDWFKHSEGLKRAIERVCNYNAMLDVFQKLITVVPQVKNACGTVSSQAKEVVEQVVKVVEHKNISTDDTEKIGLLCVSVCYEPKLLDSIKNIFQTIQSVPSIMPMVTMFVKVPYEMEFLLSRICNSSVESTDKNMSTRHAVSYGLFQAVNVALEAVSLHFLIKNFQEGSQSQHAVGIREAREQLKLQLDLVSGVYRKLRNTK